MTNSTRFKISVTAALVFSLVSGTSAPKMPVRENLFFPSQAVRAEENTAEDEPITVIKGEKIEISFRIVEVIRDMFK